MSIEVIKAGIADTVQDNGRFGYQHAGINPNGAMDLTAMKIANALVGNNLNEAVLELGFPSSSFEFKATVMMALSGADFSAKVNGINIPMNTPCLIPAGSQLKFSKVKHGQFSYLAVRGGFAVREWLGSKSANVRAKAGGNGRSLKKLDVIGFNENLNPVNDIVILPWRVNVSEFYISGKFIRCIPGNEITWLTKKSVKDYTSKQFTLSAQSDRMGFRLKGVELRQKKKQELLSTAVTFGTVQLLPNGEVIILVADHQTTGGYPRIAHVVYADRSGLVQLRPNQKITFEMIGLEDAENLTIGQQRSLQQIKTSCLYKLNEFMSKNL